ncbi:MAG: AIPR family protein [bacterium]
MDRIIQSFIEDFRKEFNYENSDYSKLFEHFINYILISKIYPDRSAIDKINVGGTRNPGIDGLAIMTNNHLVTTEEEINYFIQDADLLDIEFSFVQSKTSDSFELGGISNFCASVKEFFRDGDLDFEDELLNLKDLKNYIYANSIRLQKSPALKLYYATTGKWASDKNLTTIINSNIKDLQDSGIFSEIKFHPIDADRIKALYREIKNKITKEIIFEKHTILPIINNVTESYLGILPANELLKIISDDDGEIIKTIFYDNVRDFQGFNKVNNEIKKTLENITEKDKFVLLNNGITIVAKSLNKIGSAFKISDFQIVNGCQTSHVLHSTKELLDNKVFIPLKLIVTDDDDTINEIIKATNSQTEVKNEAFEILKPFHKKLEEFYLTFEKELNKRVFYERRSKQFIGIKAKQERIIGLPTLIAAFVAMFLNEPHSINRYFGELLKSYSSRLFQENHSFFPYYTCGLAVCLVDDFYRENKLNPTFKRFKYHLILMLRVEIAGNKVPSNTYSNKEMERYCLKLLDVLWNKDKALETFINLETKLRIALTNTKLLQRQAHLMRAFTGELLPSVESSRKNGELTFYNNTRGFGFMRISDSKEDIFVHFTEINKIFDGVIEPCLKFSFDIVESNKGPQARNLAIFKS